MTTEQIEARAFQLHQTREANAKRHGYIPRTYEGAERDFCLRSARETLEIEAHDAAVKSHEDRWYEEQFAAMSDADIEVEIARIDREVALLPYAPLTVNIDARKRAFMNDRSRCVAEQFRRSVAMGAAASSTSLDAVGERETLQAAE